MGTKTAGEAGWHESRYNLRAKVPDKGVVAIVNLYKGTCAEFGPVELYLLSVVEELKESHPIIQRFARLGVICNFDERAALQTMGRAVCAHGGRVSLTICPTMGCNFDCPYCFEDHTPSKMRAEVQDDVVALARRMIATFGAKELHVSWFGGEPLLVPDVIKSLSMRLISLANELGASYEAEIITNGYLLTAEIAEMLREAKVTRARITIDGVGPVHDATRHLAGGGATFSRIMENLSHPKLPLSVVVRHNVHEGNVDQMGPVHELVDRMAGESGNDLIYHAAPVRSNAASKSRGCEVGPLRDMHLSRLAMGNAAQVFEPGRGHHCAAHALSDVGIDEAGRLHKCWEDVAVSQLSFGTSKDWDPADPIATASDPDNLIRYLNTAAPVPDAECAECVWLPKCVGGCPHQRIFGEGRECVPYRDDVESFVLTLYGRIPAE